MLFGLVPEQWDEGGSLYLAAHDGEGWPANVLSLRMIGLPATAWAEGESHTWSYWLVLGQATSEEEAVNWMSTTCQRQVGSRE